MGALKDRELPWPIEKTLYKTTSMNKRLVGISDAGHMVFTNICKQEMSSDESGVDMGLMTIVANDGCGPDYIPEELGWEIVNYASTAVFEETLRCSKTAAREMNLINSRYEGIEYRMEFSN